MVAKYLYDLSRTTRKYSMLIHRLAYLNIFCRFCHGPYKRQITGTKHSS